MCTLSPPLKHTHNTHTKLFLSFSHMPIYYIISQRRKTLHITCLLVLPIVSPLKRFPLICLLSLTLHGLVPSQNKHYFPPSFPLISSTFPLLRLGGPGSVPVAALQRHGLQQGRGLGVHRHHVLDQIPLEVRLGGAHRLEVSPVNDDTRFLFWYNREAKR